VTEPGHYGPMPVYVDDPTTPEHDGARAGDVIHFVINGRPAIPLGPDEPIWTFNGDIWHVNLIASQVVQQHLRLKAGWNLISFSVEPPQRDVLSIMQGFIGGFTRILSMDCERGALSYYPDIPPFLNSLTEMDPWHGYWIEVTRDMPLVVTGIQQPPFMPISLCRGYNLVSYLPAAPLPVAEALASIDGLYISVLGFDPDLGALSYYPDLPPALNTLQRMEPGRGYWIKMRQDAVLIYPTP